MVAGIVLAALNLRPAITSLGALLEEVRDDLGMSGGAAGLLTSVPPLCFAVFGVTAPRLARRFRPAAVVCAGMVAIATGLAVRPYIGGTAGFLAMSALALMGIAVSNVLMPVIVKRWFPDRVGSMTGLYSMALALGTSAAAAATVPMTDALGGDWRSGLVVWAGLAAAAVLPWVLLARARGAGPGAGDREPAASGAVRTGDRAAATTTATPSATAAGTGDRAPAAAAGTSSATATPPPPRLAQVPRRPLPPSSPATRPRDCASPAAVPPGPWPSSSASRPPPPTSRWAGWPRSSATRASPPAPRDCSSPSRW